MKAYLDAGLKQLVAARSFRGETLACLSKVLQLQHYLPLAKSEKHYTPTC